jgi:prevent-host-death family protein
LYERYRRVGSAEVVCMEAVERTVSSSEARDALPELLARAAYGHERTLIARRGKPLGALIGVEEYRLFERLLEEHEDRMDAEAALAVLADEDDEVVPFERST